MIEGLENADVTMQTTKTKFQVAVGAMNNAIYAIDDYRSTAQTVYSSIDTIIQNSFDKQSQLLNEQQKQSDEYYANKMKAYEDDEAAQEELAAKQLQDNNLI